MDLKEIQLKQANFVTERNWEKFHSIENLCKAISVEAAELLEIVLWQTEINTSEISQEERIHIEEEIADILLYSLSLCRVAGIDPIIAMNDKILKNEIKYPKDKFKGKYKI